MKSLAEHLGVIDPRDLTLSKPSKPLPRQTIRDFCRDILSSDDYRASVLRRILIDEMPPAVEQLMYHYAYGKPVEKIEFKDTSDDIDEMNAEQCEQEAMRLLEIARQIRGEESTTSDRSIH